jgi:hypothetical protein
MSFSASAADERVLDVQSTDDTLSGSLRDGRVITVPLVWYPRLLSARIGRLPAAATGFTGPTWTKI